MDLRNLLRVLPPLVLSIFLFTSGSTHAQTRTIDEEVYLGLKRISSPAFSPDGSKIVFSVTEIDRMRDRRDRSIWIMDVSGDPATRMARGSYATWSPDGTKVVFSGVGEGGRPRIFLKEVGIPDPPVPIVEPSGSPRGLALSPDGEHLVFEILVGEREVWDVPLPEPPEGARWASPPQIIPALDSHRDRLGILGGSFSQLFIVGLDGGEPRQITSGRRDNTDPVWSPDGTKVYYRSEEGVSTASGIPSANLFSVDVQTLQRSRLTHHPGRDSNLVVSPGGDWVAFARHEASRDTYQEAQLIIMRPDGSEERRIAGGLGRNLSGLNWAPKGDGVYFNAELKGTRNLWIAPLDGPPKPVTAGNHVLTASSIDRSGNVLAIISTSSDPGEIWRFSVTDPDKRIRLTALNDRLLDGVRRATVEEVSFESLGRLMIQGWLMKPPDFDPAQQYPLILAIHGGPHGMFNVGFNYEFQNHASEGYLVLFLNPRGSAGYGVEFGNLIQYAFPGDDFHDLMAGVDEVLKREYVDPQNLFVYGGSSGGTLAAWIVGHTNRFSAAAVLYPVVDWFSFVGISDDLEWYFKFQDLPWDNPSEHLERSPLSHVGSVETPTLLMTGEADRRTPSTQAQEFFSALKVREVPAVLLRFPGEVHGIRRFPSNYLRTQRYLQAWFNTWTR
jgi:dipeptidyl aminopeptidase/acylaminoacyl peptidase